MNIPRPHHLLYLLAATLLLMQSFAVWHDAEHAFHDHIAECERFEAITHHPVVDKTPALQLVVVQALLRIEASVPAHLQLSDNLDLTPIRGPPLA